MIKIDFSLLIAYCMIIYWLSAQTFLPAPQWFEHQDKLHHATAYAVMAFWTWRAFRHLTARPVILAFVSLIFCSLYGISDEWHQSFVLGRESDAADWLADTLGAALMISVLYKRRFFVAKKETIHASTQFS